MNATCDNSTPGRRLGKTMLSGVTAAMIVLSVLSGCGAQGANDTSADAPHPAIWTSLTPAQPSPQQTDATVPANRIPSPAAKTSKAAPAPVTTSNAAPAAPSPTFSWRVTTRVTVAQAEYSNDLCTWAGQPFNQTFTFNGFINVNKVGLVEFMWINSAGATSPLRSIDFSAAHIEFDRSDQFTVIVPGAVDGWMKLKVLSPVVVESTAVHFVRTCMG